MRLTKIEITGYKRLKEARTYVSGRLLAFVGPNEAGKSSVLDALLTYRDGSRIESSRRTRGAVIHDDDTLVRATFLLDEDDQEAVAHLGFVAIPTSIVMDKQAGGDITVGYHPDPHWTNDKRLAASALLKEIEPVLVRKQAEMPEGSDERDAFQPFIDEVKSAIIRLDNLKSSEVLTRIQWQIVTAAVESLSGDLDVTAHLQAVSAMKEQAETDPWEACHSVLERYIPSFVKFDDASRDLRHEYGLRDPEIATGRPPALENLLNLAGLQYDEIVAVLDDTSTRETMLLRANCRLAEVFKDKWRQAGISVHLNITADRLQIMIHEYDSETRSALDQRSDGLRTFVALTAFLGSGDYFVPPILLIDEAETHLHYDAQADLINMLTSQDITGQVLYTTHSPGCLPRDLGRGVRFVEPDLATETSRIRHDFWSYEDKKERGGFSALLFVMGAGAAAFASVRFAVIGEGPTEMLLLPSLLRVANNLNELPYQVAPGISTLAKSGFPALGTIAARACYLVDGDTGGSSLEVVLRDQEVPVERIFRLDPGLAIEDLVDRAQYLNAVSQVTGEPFDRLDQAVVPQQGRPIRSVLADWCSAEGIALTGPIPVAEALLGSGEDIKVRDESRATLVALHESFMSAFDFRSK